MHKDTTEVAVVVDCSGSMAEVVPDAVGAFNSFVRAQQREPGNCNLTVVMFSNKPELWYRGDVQKCPIMREEHFSMMGSTALYDSMGQVSKDALDAFLMSAADDRPPVTIAILTDGEENCSRTFDEVSLADIVTKCKAQGFIYILIGMGIDARDQVNDLAQSLGIDQNHTRVLMSGNKGQDVQTAVNLLSGSVSSTRAGGDGSLMKMDYQVSDDNTNPYGSYRKKNKPSDTSSIDFLKKPSPWSKMKKD